MAKLNASFTLAFQDDSLVIHPHAHTHTLLWLTGLNYQPAKFLDFFLTDPIVHHIKHFRIVIPCPPLRKTTILNGQEVVSWYDIKQRTEKSFHLPLNEVPNHCIHP